VVTGGLGFIGSNVAHRLVGAGASVVVVDALVERHGGDRRNLDGIAVEVLEADIGDPAMTDVLRDADFVFNLAGQVSHTASMTAPQVDLALNTMSHAKFLEMLREARPSARVVHSSTRQVYGRALRLPVDEDHPANPIDVNGVAKLAGEQLHMVYAHAHQMPITSLRLTNVYGSRQRLTSDELGFLPVFIRRALRGEQIDLYGGGTQRRDCLYIDDVVDAILTATHDDGIGKVFNVGHEVSHSLAEIADVIVREAGSGSQVATAEWPDHDRRIDIGSFLSDSSRIERELGWRPSTTLTAGVRATLDFYREHPWYLSST
jgi:nucleoside-diphosphate-sugar epimerase